LALTSSTCGGRSLFIVRSQIKATEFGFIYFFIFYFFIFLSSERQALCSQHIYQERAFSAWELIGISYGLYKPISMLSNASSCESLSICLHLFVVGFVRRPGVLACFCLEIDTGAGVVSCPVAKVSSFGSKAAHVTGFLLSGSELCD
jgi:hypothetical protein